MIQPTDDRHFRPILMDNPLRRLFSSPRETASKYVSKGNVVADLGCGPGYFTLSMAEAVGPTGRVYAVDSDPNSIRVVTTKAAKRGYACVIEARVSSAAELSFIPSASVDFVFANGLICCMIDHAGATREIKRILKPGGLAYLSVSKANRKKDARVVEREEWRRLIGEFRFLNGGEGLTSRWAVVSLKGALPLPA